uniref:Ground-like domain-containing protein n=1 Tax=Panagrellus redivivus TaxID=6233 RepID=A0A7E4VKP9_PANRE
MMAHPRKTGSSANWIREADPDEFSISRGRRYGESSRKAFLSWNVKWVKGRLKWNLLKLFTMLKFVVLSCALVASQALFFPPAAGGGGCGCGSPAPACPPPAAPACPPPPPPPQCPVAPSCGGGGAYASPAQSYAPQYAPQAAPGPVFQGVSGGQGYAQAPQAPLPSLSLPFAGQQGPVGGPQGGSYQQAPGPIGGQQQGGQYQQIPQQTFVPQPQEPQEPFVPEAPAAAQGQQYQEQVPQVPQEQAPQEQQQQQQQQEYQNQEVHPTEINNEDAAYEDVGQNPGVGEIQEPYPEVETNQEPGPYDNAKTKAKAAAAPTHKADPKCNSETLRKLIHENIHEKTSIAKRQIQAKAAAEVGGRIDVICSSGVFSYIVNTELYCETEKNGITCLAFRQAS